jgi:hypothetical protein
MREGDAGFIKQSLDMLGKGGVLVSGKRLLPDGTMESPVVFSNHSAEENLTVSIPWSVSQADFTKLAQGMGLKEVGEILDLSALHYIPNGPQSRFTLVCNHLNRRVMLVFAGNPEAKLVSMSAEGTD